jgi:hypothetical protein
MNDWQKLYVLTEGVTPAALLTMGRLRAALAAGDVTADEAALALQIGEEGISELLESQTEEFSESLDDSFDQFGRLV